MFNNISSINFNNNSNANISTAKSNEGENVSIFGNNLIKNEKIELTKEEKKAKKLAEKVERQKIASTPDGIIQGGTQGSTAGDCWLLAQMNSMAKTSWGKEALKNAITQENDGSYTVHFESVQKDIKITSEEFKKAQKNSNLSHGDADALLLEVAVEKHFKNEDINNGSIKGNDLAGEDSLQFLLTGEKGHQTTQEKYYEPILQLMGQNPDDNAGIAATYTFFDDKQGPDGTSHVLSIQQVVLNKKGEVKEVILKDSYRPDVTFSKSYGQFVNELQGFGFTTPPRNKNTEKTPDAEK